MTQDSNTYPPFSVGVDLGGTNTVYGIVDGVGHVLASGSFPTRIPDFEKWCDTLADGIRELIAQTGTEGRIEGVGLGAPCANATTGCIEGSVNLPWPSPVPVAKMLGDRLGLKVRIQNDANTAAGGEMKFGAGVGLNNFLVLTLGTGVGAGIVVDGHLLSGRNGFAGELGHVTFPFAADRRCGCGRKGCLETVASAGGIVETARRFLELSKEPSSLRGISIDKMTARDISLAAQAGDRIAAEVYDFTGRCLGKAAAEFAAFCDPEAVFLFGGVAKAGDLLLVPMREAFRECVLHLYRDRVRFGVSGLREADAALLGAASLALIGD